MTERKSSSGSRPNNTGARRRSGVASKEMLAARRKKRHREVIRNRIIFGACVLIILLLIIFGLIKLISAVSGGGRAADSSTITFEANGTVTFEEIVDFDEDNYSKKDLENYTNDLIDSFNEAYGSDAITLDSVKVSDGVAYMKTTYVDYEAYSTFTTYDVYNGDIAGAMDAGYDFNENFALVTDGVKGDTVSVDYTTDFASLGIAIVSQNINVVVPGDIYYVSTDNTEILSADTVSISNIEGGSDTVYIVYSIENN